MTSHYWTHVARLLVGTVIGILLALLLAALAVAAHADRAWPDIESAQQDEPATVALDLDVLRELYREHGLGIVAVRDKCNRDGTRFHVIEPGSLVRRFARPDLLVDWEYDGQRHQTRLRGAS